MSYIRRHLMAGEVVAREGRLSRILYLPALFAWVAAIVSLVLVLRAGETARQALVIPAVLAAVGVVLALAGACRRASAEFAVTNKRVVVKTGTPAAAAPRRPSFARSRASRSTRASFGRIFNYGTIVVEGTGTDKVPYAQIADPLGFRLAVLEQIDKEHEQRSARRPCPTTQSSRRTPTSSSSG
jgi:hypothetical protein